MLFHVAAGGLRIIGGTLKGRRIETPAWEGLRPTSDRLRETLFNVLAPRIGGARVLDGFAGTGAVGIEALSRGAVHVTFVEEDRRAADLIARNLERVGLSGGVRLQADNRRPAAASPYAIIRARFAAAAARLAAGEFDVLFLDPPYGAAALADALASAAPLVGPQALLIIEHARRDEGPEAAAGLARTRTIVSGDSALSFYAKDQR
jgi:16S rRNA (guanine966-N2)-methyltransferase